MALRWTSKAHSDLVRLYEFLGPVNPAAAVRVVRQVVAGAKQIGLRLADFAPREVRRVLVGDYEIRYEVADKDVTVLRIFHTREDR